MAHINGQMTASGLAGALASVFTASMNQFVPDSNLKAIISVLAGMTASAIVFEFLSWSALLKLPSNAEPSKSLFRVSRVYRIKLTKQSNAN